MPFRTRFIAGMLAVITQKNYETNNNHSSIDNDFFYLL